MVKGRSFLAANGPEVFIVSDDEKLRILLLADRLEQPGVGVYTAELTDRLCEEGHAVLLALQEGGRSGRLAWGPAVVESWRPPVRGLAWLLGYRCEPAVGDFQPHVVHAVTPRVGVAAQRLGRRLMVPVAVTVHGTTSVEDDVAQRALRTSAVIALSEAVREDLVNHLHVPKERIRLIYPGVRLPDGPPAEPVPQDRTLIVGTIGSLDYIGGHRYLLEALRKLLDRGMDLQLLIAGDGPRKVALRELAARLKLNDDVTFTDSAADPRELLEVMDLFVLTNTREGMSPLVLEAMALGKPVAVSGAGGTFAAVQHNHTGLVFPKGDADALAEAILRLVIKPDFAQRLVREARELIQRKFSVDRMIDETVAVYEKLIGRRRPAPPTAE